MGGDWKWSVDLPLCSRAVQKEAKSRTAFARMLVMFFYKEEEEALKGKRLHELDQDIVHELYLCR